MRTKNGYLIIAGLINLFTALLHIIGGQVTLVNPLLKSNLTNEIKSQLLGAWHIVTILLFFTSLILLYTGFKRKIIKNVVSIKFIGNLYVLIAIPFVISGFIYKILVPQWILLFPIGVLVLFGLSKNRNKVN